MNNQDLPERVLLLGAIDHEGILSAIKGSGREYIRKILHSKIENWDTILDLFEEYNIEAVLGKFTRKTYEFLADPEYSDVVDKLFKALDGCPHVIFVFEDLLAGNEDHDPFMRHIYKPLSSKDIIGVNERLTESGLQVLPYKTKAEVTVSAQHFLEGSEQGLLFRIYVPAKRLWAEEIDRVLILFRDYVGKVWQAPIRLDQVRTSQGVIYAFHGDKVLAKEDFSSRLNDFSHFMDLAARDPSAAEEFLRHTTADPTEIISIVTRYSKESRRLNLDMKQHREAKVLALRHRLESELVDAIPSSCDVNIIGRIVEACVPSVTSIPLLDAPASLDSIPTQLTCIPTDIHNQIEQRLVELVNEEVFGTIEWSDQDRQLIELFKKHGGKDNIALMSSLHELRDHSVPPSARVTAGQRIKGFLLKVGGKVGDTSLVILQEYIKSKLGI